MSQHPNVCIIYLSRTHFCFNPLFPDSEIMFNVPNTSAEKCCRSVPNIEHNCPVGQ